MKVFPDWVDPLRQDLRFSRRSLRRSPGFTAAVVATLALCIGANSTVFSVLYGLMLKPLPFHHSQQLVEVYSSMPKLNQPKGRLSVAQYLDYKASADLFDGFALWATWTFNIGEDGDPERGIGARVTADYFQLTGVQPLLGRFFTLEESAPGRDFVLVLSQTYWERKFGADPSVIGRVIRLGGQPFTIVGVAPRQLEELNADAVLLKPFEWTTAQIAPPTRIAPSATLYARLKPGVLPGSALAQLSTLEQRFYATAAPPGMRSYVERTGYKLGLGRVRAEQTQPIRTGLWLLQSAACLVLLLGCVNVANLLLARANARHTELAVRQALGAGRTALARQLLVEALLLSLAGAVIGCALSWASLQLINTYTTTIAREVQPVTLNVVVLATTTVIAIATAVLMAALPVARTWGNDVLAGLQSGSRGSSASSGLRAISGMLITAQVALALVLLIGAGLLLRSFGKVLATEPGFDVRHVLQARVVFGGPNSRPEALFSEAQLILARMREIPGIEQVAATGSFAISGRFPIVALPLRDNPTNSLDLTPRGSLITATPEYFDVMGIRLVEGRLFNDDDVRPDARTAFVVDQQFARRYFPDRSPVGEVLATNRDTPPEKAPIIVGVVTNAKLNGLEDRSGVPFVFLPLRPGAAFSIVARTHHDPHQVIAAMRAKLRAVDPSAPLYNAGTLEESLDWLLMNRRGVMWLLGTFAGIALLLSAVGIYGMLAYDVSQRTREIGVRAAIGATRAQIVGLIFRQGLRKTTLGLAIGLGLACYFSHFMQNLLFDVKPWDAAAYGGVIAVLLLVSLLASWLPALRAARVDPIVALKTE